MGIILCICREEETVMDNLRKRVGELQLDKNWKRTPREKEVDKEGNEEEKPLLKVNFIGAKNIVKLIHMLPKISHRVFVVKIY